MPHTLASARIFAHRHDELPAFHAAYLVITILSAALLSLGAFGALIVAHMALDYVKYRDKYHFTMRRTMEGMIRESLFDIALLLIALTFTVYFHHTMAVASVSGLLRSELTLVRALGTVVPKFLILNESLKVWVHVRNYLEHPHPRIGKAWTLTERLAIMTVITGILALVLAAPLLHTDPHTIATIIGEELMIWVR
ncbi:MAG: hypothetical protein Greene041662_507 [Candidatus Peregrinibacteria bacterium Greene0416_62]|nr:MAG: hypothetical protein Greene041662_507 [Candidatus Peregrinibacteria bacterium Greene0416_62]